MTTRPGAAFRRLAVSTAVVTYLLIIMGGIVRVTGSGLGCGVRNDWPLCHGGLLPPLQPTAIIEFSHRWIAAVATALVIALAVSALIWQRRHRRIAVASTVAAVLFIVQIALGALTVEFKLPGSIVMIHLANALLLLGVLVYVAAITVLGERSGQGVPGTWSERSDSSLRDRTAFRERSAIRLSPRLLLQPQTGSAPRRPVTSLSGPLTQLLLIAAAATYLLALSGAFVVENAAGAACAGWPLCGGGWQLPASDVATINVLHRVVAGFVALFVGGVMVTLIRSASNAPWLRAIAVAVIAVLLLQIAAGALAVELGLPAPVRALHIALASALWALVVLATVLVRSRQADAVPVRSPVVRTDAVQAPAGAATL
jgi:heme A synthase